MSLLRLTIAAFCHVYHRIWRRLLSISCEQRLSLTDTRLFAAVNRIQADRFAVDLDSIHVVEATGVCSTQIVSGSTASRSPPSRSSSPRLRSLFSKLHKIGIL